MMNDENLKENLTQISRIFLKKKKDKKQKKK